MGHVLVDVGTGREETERFVVPAELLCRPPIAKLLRRAPQKYGYARQGPLRIPCPAAAFRCLLGALAGAAAAVRLRPAAALASMKPLLNSGWDLRGKRWEGQHSRGKRDILQKRC